MPRLVAGILALAVASIGCGSPSDEVDSRSDCIVTADTPSETPPTVLDNASAPTLLPYACGTDLDLLLEGDSAASTIGGDPRTRPDSSGLIEWGDETGRFTVANAGEPGCGMTRGGEHRIRGLDTPVRDCVDWAERYAADLDGTSPAAASLSDGPPELVAVLAGTWDVPDRLLPSRDRWMSFGDPDYDEFYASEIAEAMDILTAQGSIVVWLTHPLNQSGLHDGIDPQSLPENDPARMRRMNDLIREAAASRPLVNVLDLAGHMARQPGGELDPLGRSDGIHWTEAAADQLATWLGPQLIRIYDQTWRRNAGSTDR